MTENGTPNTKRYIMTTLMTNIELDADILSVACAMEGPLRKEDVVPHMMSNTDWQAAKDFALAEGWISKDELGPMNRGARYVSSDPTLQQLEEVDIFEQMGLTAFDYAADQHLDMAQSMFEANPGKAFNAWDLRRGRQGPCTKATWPYVRDNLMRNAQIDMVGSRRSRTYTHVPLQWQMEEHILYLENLLSKVRSVLLPSISEELKIDDGHLA